MSKNIKKLPANVISKIAAGEVVERPVSIVKELIENSIDAHSTKINIEISAGGVDYIIISDNGDGIYKDDLQDTLTLHATSKLSDITDLEKILTLGFRGEALASISAVSDIEIISKSHSEEIAYQITDSDLDLRPASRNQGTTIKVRNLFRKIPARKKFLKSERSEEQKIRELIRYQALNFPEIEFNYKVDNREIYKLEKSDLKSRISELYKINQSDLIEVESDGYIFLKGYVTHPRAGSKRPTQFISINNRVIKNNLIAVATRRGYGNRLPVELKPHLFFKITVPGENIDVNIHPRKEEVKFSTEKEIFKEILHAVENSVSNNLSSEFSSKFDSMSSETIPNRVNLEYSKNSKDSNFLQEPSKSTYKNQTARPTLNGSNLGIISKSLDFSKKMLMANQPSETFKPNTNHALVDNDIRNNDDYPSQLTEFKVSQIFATYIIVEKKDKIMIVDQHAAAERINYEKLKKKDNELTAKTPLLIPQEIEIKEEVNSELFSRLKEKVSRLGIEIERDENISNRVIVKSMPVLLVNKTNPQQRVSELLETEVDVLISEDDIVSDFEEGIDYEIARLACHGSIRAGEILESQRMIELINSLEKCDNPHTCPHGRPTFWELSRHQIEKNFMRIKP